MVPYRPAAFVIGQTPAPAAVPAPAPTVVVPASSGYSGIPGFLETAAVLTVSAAAAWVGIKTGMEKKGKGTLGIAGYVGGVGSALMGLLYLGSKTGFSPTGVPRVMVSA